LNFLVSMLSLLFFICILETISVYLSSLFRVFPSGRSRVDGTPVPGLKPHIERLYHTVLGT
jgi:hypothetical protein